MGRALAGALGLLLMLSSGGLPAQGADGSAPSPAPAPRRPSVLLILADDLGYGDLGCYGQQKIKTPNIDRLAAEGMRFTSFYGGSAVCEPSRAALLTGRHTGHLSIRGESPLPQSLTGQETTMAQLLQLSGYRTGFIGEWELGDRNSPGAPGSKGFEQCFGYLTPLAAHDRFPATLYRNENGSERQVLVLENQGRQGKYADDFFSEAALNFLQINVPEAFNHYRPFFLYLPYTIAHANNELAQLVGNGMQVPNDAPYSNEAWPQAEKNKAAMITRLDNYVGSLLQSLKDHREEQNTIVIFTSDNGPHNEGGVDPKFFRSAGGLRGIKRDLHEGGIRVPFIVRWPFAVTAGTVSDLPCALWDVFPTVMEAAYSAAPRDIDGISLLPTLTGQTQTNRHEFLYWETHGTNGFCQAVRMGDWKALRAGADGPLELYNLKADPTEKTNVADQHIDELARIATYLKSARTPDEHWPIKTPTQENGSAADEGAAARQATAGR